MEPPQFLRSRRLIEQLFSGAIRHVLLSIVVISTILVCTLIFQKKLYADSNATLPLLGSSLPERDLEQDLAAIAIDRRSGKPEMHKKLLADRALFEKDKWIVVTTINPPTEAIRILASLQEWQLVVVADTKTPVEWNVEGVHYLSLEKQKMLNYRISNLVPFENYGRKNIGYLFAIQHGAKVVYETDDDNIFIMDQLSQAFDLDLESPMKDVFIYNASQGSNPRNVVNPYIHFGQAGVWPRGYPLDAIATNSPEDSYHMAAIMHARPLIQQGLANGDPDVDAIFRLTRRSSGEKIDFEFDSEARPVLLPDHLFSPFNSQNTLFHYEAFWGLLLPITTAFRVCDIWRGYFAQRLLWDLKGHLGFYPPSVRQDRNIHNYFLDFMDEDQLYKDGRRLVDFLDNWASQESSFFDRVLSLSKEMVRQGFWKQADAHLTASWLSDLLTVGYIEPVLEHFHAVPTLNGSITSRGLESTPLKAMPSSYLKTCYSLKPSLEGCAAVGTCDGKLPHNLDVAFCELAKWRAYFSNVVLIINYNHVHHQSVPFWRALYSRIFQHIEFVSEEGDQVLGVRKVVGLSGGCLFYRALPTIFAAYPNAEGFLYTNDDVVLNYWNLYGADKEKLWLRSTYTVMIRQSNDTVQFTQDGSPIMKNCESNSGNWWCMSWSERRRNAALDAINNMTDRFKERLDDFCGTLATDERAVISTIDFFYIPQRLVSSLSNLIPSFVRREVFSEMAMPTMLHAIAKTSEDIDSMVFSNVSFLWGGYRNQVEQLYDAKLHALHPWKPTDEHAMGKILSALSKGDPTLLGLNPTDGRNEKNDL